MAIEFDWLAVFLCFFFPRLASIPLQIWMSHEREICDGAGGEKSSSWVRVNQRGRQCGNEKTQEPRDMYTPEEHSIHGPLCNSCVWRMGQIVNTTHFLAKVQREANTFEWKTQPRRVAFKMNKVEGWFFHKQESSMCKFLSMERVTCTSISYLIKRFVCLGL